MRYILILILAMISPFNVAYSAQPLSIIGLTTDMTIAELERRTKILRLYEDAARIKADSGEYVTFLTTIYDKKHNIYAYLSSASWDDKPLMITYRKTFYDGKKGKFNQIREEFIKKFGLPSSEKKSEFISITFDMTWYDNKNRKPEQCDWYGSIYADSSPPDFECSIN
ncbi:hypothetical protein N5853_09525 [Bartonella sp. HY329]|uniref:hypothetical protein n=1 Tax=unclassified Bartonella TaxID=2645622 RepID=UPI0021CA03E8|nr:MULTISPECIES: hypothetical protein [unclassified Bartonella]UXM94347.1 hypothetical protein N5853_09525 [Bartonella sp. HY329]UXN08670.1 hypothetical protein N5852_09535 [Bartonella sp. HY328]